MVSRYGGEEFAILLPETDMDLACIVAEKLRAEVCARPALDCGFTIQTTISLGVSAYPGPGILSKQDLFNQADKALYQAKKAGRNRVEAACNEI